MQVHDINRDGVLDRLRNRKTRSIGSFFHSVYNKAKGAVSDVGHGVEEGWDRVKQGAETAYHAVANEAEKAYHAVANEAETVYHAVASKWYIIYVVTQFV